MQPIILIGGGEIAQRETEQIDRLALAQGRRVLFVPIAAFDSEGYAETFKRYYTSLGAQVDVVYITKESDQEVIEKINNTDIVYLSGGDTQNLLSNFKPSFIQAIRKKTIVGISAGALALSKRCLLTKDKDTPETKIIPGFGLIDFTTEVHFDGNAEEITKLDIPVYAIGEKSCIIVDDKKLTFIGDVTYFKNDP
ncbi:MAG: Type 1 glutamine amidotransferase-like domain-containing protein [Candidatus Woesearchaeota archaeon]